jgi:cytoskeletal protein CcmA (bactofilin family)
MFGKSRDKHENMPLAAPVVLTDPTSSISRDVTVVGKIFGEGTVQLFGRIEGEVSASTVLIKEGAQVEGDVFAEELTIAGQVNGTIHANRVKLNSTAIVEGDIFHRSLSIDENARFEGLSKHEDNARGVLRSPLSRSSTQDDCPSNVTTTGSIDRVQHALDVVAALRGGSRLADLSPTAPPAEPRDCGAGALNDFASVEDAIPDDDESGSDPKEIQESESSG